MAQAQRGSEFGKATATLPADAQTTLNRLAALRLLPDGKWKMHSGDLAHGEAIGLDDSGWESVGVGYKAPTDTAWFRQTYTVPETLDGYDLTGACIWFQFHANGNGPMPEILYFNGRRVALGEDLEPVVMIDQVKPGDKVVVAVKLLHTVDTKTIRGATLRIDIPETRPNPVDLWQEILSAAEIVPSLAPGDKAKMQTVLDAIATVDTKALDAHDQAKFDESVKAASAKLAALKPTLQTATYHLDGNGHIDAAWLWPWTETVDVVKRTFGTALQLMYEYPGYTYSQSAAAYNEWLADKYPEVNAEIAQRIKEGRWEIVGGMWVEPDLNMPDGESLVRQLLVGNRWFKKHYGVTARIGWNPDSFGYTWQLPQILKKSGLDYFVTQKMSWNDTNQFPFKLFWWESPDGSKVLTYFPRNYVNTTLNPVRLVDDLKVARTYAPGSTELLDLYGVGDHGGGPTRATLDEGFHWSNAMGDGASKITPNYKFGGAQAFFTAMEKQIAPESPVWNYLSIAKGYTPPQAENGKITVPTWKAELYFEYHRGVMTTQANQKRNMRESEEQALNAEKYASLAWLYGNKYPGDELTEDWKKILFNQFHDTAAGSGIGVIYADAQKDYDVVRWSTNEISAASLATVAAEVDTHGLALPEPFRTLAKERAGEAIPVVVFNPLGWERSGEVTVRVQAPSAELTNFVVVDPANDGKPATVLASKVDAKTGVAELTVHVDKVPALGYKTIGIVPTKLGSVAGSSALDDGEKIRISENRLVVEVDKKTGCITRLEKDGFETLAKGACGNELQLFKDLPQKYDAWNVDPGTFDVAPATMAKADSVELIDGKSSHPAIRVVRTWQSSKFVQTLSLPPGAGLVDVDNEIDWHERHILLKAAFALAATSNFATCEIPYGTIERTTTRNNSWEKAQFEVPAMRWADLGDGQHGLSLLNQDKYGYDAVGNLLRLTLLRAPTWPDPEADQGHHHFHYALYPHAGTWKEAGVVRKGWEYDYPLTATVTTAHAGTLSAAHSFISVEPENVVLTAVKKAEDAKGLILRVYEWAGKTGTIEFHVPAGAKSATVTNMSETPEGAGLELKDGVVKAPIHPYEILTVRVDYPEAGPKK
ncbi:MAG: glycoside hydrolase family 38 C-terminal domain-containing protein [Terracidiphilus sp.]|nr:glycoside hydrolase family 38 C-terminal domain-containing protein [Terracidiphilus sp.]